ncbi:MAG: glycosyltransferase family 4 protein [Opitutales bacterium]|nr:glycosyltransferase family 4 protein [Opitutales bacterium]
MKLIIFTTHPIQYQVPIFQELVRQGVDLHVYYASDHSIKGGFDKGFNQRVKWDIPLLEGYQNTFLTNKGRGYQKNSFFSYRCPEIKRILKSEQPEAVIIPGYNRFFYLEVIFWCRRYGFPIYLRGNNLDGTGPLRTSIRNKLRSCILFILYRQFDGFFSIGTYMTRHYIANRVDPAKIHATPYCNNTPLFEKQRATFSPLRDKLRKEFNIPKESQVVLTSGRFIPWKRIDLIIDALAELKQTLPIFFICLGDGPEREKLHTRIKTKLGGCYLVPGFINQSELGRYYACADLFVLASDRYHETWGLVVNEAMAFGLPVVVSDGVGCREDLVEKGEAGLVFEAGNCDSLKECMQTILTDCALSSKMAQNAARIIQQHTVEENAKQILLTLSS